MERSSSPKTLLYSLDSKSCTAETVSSHTLLIPQLLLSGARAANIVFPRNHNVHWPYFVNTRLLCSIPLQVISVQQVLRSYTAEPGLV